MPPDLSRGSPTGTTNNVLSNSVFSESPVSAPQSTPAIDPSAASERMGSDDTVPPLRMDDIQSTVPLDDALENNERAYMLS